MIDITRVSFRLAAVTTVALGIGLLGGKLWATPQNSAPVAPRAPMTMFKLPSSPPPGAVVLLGGKQEQIPANFYKRYSKNAGDWTVDAEGATTPKADDLTSQMEFGDCTIHAEFQCSVDAAGKSIGEGNSGIGLQGRYEVQMYDSFGHKPSPIECGAFFSQKAPLVIASRKAGEWQTFDIIFRAPRFDPAGTVTEKARATVFLNGVLVQNNEEFNGPTGIQYGELKGQVKTGPIILQGDHSPVHFRNVWVVPL